MNIDINLDAIKADMDVVGDVYVKFDKDLSAVYEGEIDVTLPTDVQVEGLSDDLECLFGMLDSLREMVDGHTRGIYSILEVVRCEADKMKGS